MEKVTIIISVYNCEKFITQTIESVKKQTYTNWELIIVNDGSNDGSFEKIIEETHDIKSKTKIYMLIQKIKATK